MSFFYSAEGEEKLFEEWRMAARGEGRFTLEVECEGFEKPRRIHSQFFSQMNGSSVNTDRTDSEPRGKTARSKPSEKSTNSRQPSCLSKSLLLWI